MPFKYNFKALLYDQKVVALKNGEKYQAYPFEIQIEEYVDFISRTVNSFYTLSIFF